MGHRAFRTGDLVAPLVRLSTLDLWAQPEDNFDSSDITVHNFSLGLLLCLREFKWTQGVAGFKSIKAMILDSTSMKYGWVDAKFLRRID